MPHRLSLFAFIFLALSGICFAEVDFPAKPAGGTRVALLGCLRQNLPAPALAVYPKLDADIALWVGDNVYADTRDDPSFIERCYEQLAGIPGFQELRNSAEFAVTWDDHDYGLNNSGKEYALKSEARAIFRRFWALEQEIPEQREGIWHSRTFEAGAGKILRIVLLDVRSHRDAPAPDGDMLGEEQWRWLEQTLTEPADFTIIASGTQILVHRESGMESWEQYPQAQRWLLEVIRRAGSQRVAIVTGDQHYSEVGRKRDALDFDLVEFTFAGVNQTEDAVQNDYRVASASTGLHSVGFLDIQWEATQADEPHVLFRVYDAQSGALEISYRLNFDELELPVGFSGDALFVDSGTAMLASPFPELELRYTVDGSEPSTNSPLYAEPLTFRETTLVRAAYFHPDGWQRSPAQEFRIERVEPLTALQPEGKLRPGLAFHYYEGDFQVLPRFQDLEPKVSGVAEHFDVQELAARADHYAILFEGWLEAPATGLYEIAVRSDDGSRLYLHGRELVDNDGSHSPRTRLGKIALEAGLHPLRLEYFEDYMGQELQLFWKTPDGREEIIPSESFHTEEQ